jgi:hypothetical protein
MDFDGFCAAGTMKMANEMGLGPEDLGIRPQTQWYIMIFLFQYKAV